VLITRGLSTLNYERLASLLVDVKLSSVFSATRELRLLPTTRLLEPFAYIEGKAGDNHGSPENRCPDPNRPPRNPATTTARRRLA
jgi:hypothetical protein